MQDSVEVIVVGAGLAGLAGRAAGPRRTSISPAARSVVVRRNLTALLRLHVRKELPRALGPEGAGGFDGEREM
jgi:hypothetical protein